MDSGSDERKREHSEVERGGSREAKRIEIKEGYIGSCFTYIHGDRGEDIEYSTPLLLTVWSSDQ